MKAFVTIAAGSLALSAPLVAEEATQDRESAFVACLAEKDSTLIAAIRDAESEEAFLAALKKGAELCKTDVEGMSMGKLFRELAKHKAPDAGDSE